MSGLRVLAIVLLSAVCALAHADTPKGDSAAYEALIRRAVAEFRAGAWEEARALFREAHAREPSARTLRGLALTAFELHRYVDCTVEFESALAHPVRPLDDTQRAEAERLLARAREFVAHVAVVVEPPDAQLLVDGEAPVVREGTVLLDPGLHTLTVHAPSFRDRQEFLRVEAGEARSLRLALEPAASPALPLPPSGSAPGPARSEPSPSHRALILGLASGGGAALATGVGLWIAAYVRSKNVQRCDDAQDDCQGDANRGRRLERSAYAFAGVGVALGAASVTIWTVDAKRARGVALGVAPSGLAVRGRF